MDEVSDEEFERVLEKVVNKHSEILSKLADDTDAMKAIVARDGCAYCGSHKHPCSCSGLIDEENKEERGCD